MLLLKNSYVSNEIFGQMRAKVLYVGFFFLA